MLFETSDKRMQKTYYENLVQWKVSTEVFKLKRAREKEIETKA